MTKLFLDVDGVINADYFVDGANGWGTWSEGFANGGGRDYKIKWAPPMIDALKSLDLDLHWLTTWREYAPASIAPLIGWGEDSPYLDFTTKWSEYGSINGKSAALKQYVAQNNIDRFVWIDDELSWSAQHMQWAKSVGGLAISPNPSKGVDPADVQTIREYLSE